MDKEFDKSNLFNVRDGLKDLFNRPSFHQPAIDGVRAIAVLWVLMFHVWFFQNIEWTNGHVLPFYDSIFNNFAFSWLVKGGLGVDMFFVISGFLIGSIIFKEIKRSDKMNFRRFYARRFLRLMPVYVVAMILAVFFLKGENIDYAWANLLYVNNFISIENQYMGWCWSLAIEEQFYLIAPIFLLMMRKSEQFFMWCVGLLFIGWLLRILALEYYDLAVYWDFRDLGSDTWVGRFNHTYDNFYTRYGGLLIGVMAAWLHIYREGQLKHFFDNSKRIIFFSAIALTLFVISSMLDMKYLVDTPYVVQLTWYAIERDIFAASLAFLIIAALYSKDVIAQVLSKILGAKILYPIAQLSYSAYLMHEMIMIWLFPISTEFFIITLEISGNFAFILNAVLGLVLTFVSAMILYVFVERPCMRLRHHPMMKKIELSSLTVRGEPTGTSSGSSKSTVVAASAVIAGSAVLEAEILDEDLSKKLSNEPMFGTFSLKPALSIVLVMLLLSSTILYTVISSDEGELEDFTATVMVNDPTIFVTDSAGMPVNEQPLEMDFIFSDVGETGKEPSIGITSSGCMFFIAMEKPMRSCDYGETWTNVADITQAPFTSDPYGWVDPVTDRVFNIHMMGLESTWIGWSDNDGESWLGNPHDSGTTPLNDHIKLATGPWRDEGIFGPIGQINPIYETAVYFCFNKLVGISCFTSFDGGASFEVGGNIVGLASTNGGLHGAITTAPDGTVYVTPRVATPTLILSKDNGLTWDEIEMGTDVGTPNPRKNSEVATDSESNAYHIWTGEDQGIYMSTSTDSGLSWNQNSMRISPAEVISTAFPQTDAGDPGRIAITYLGSENVSLLNTTDIDGNNWNGNGHYAPGGVHYYIYVTYSLNALDENPTFHTRRLSSDPVQIGAMCLNSGDCRSDEGGSNRNLLDFNDLTIDLEGRVYIAFADGCIDACASSEDPQPADSRAGRGSVYFMANGPSLYVEEGEMMSPVDSSETQMPDKMTTALQLEVAREESYEE